jgi:uncharacterized RDD family membrane protein YckC
MAQGFPTRMVTPEAVALEFQTANVGSRILAFLIDLLVVGTGIFVGVVAVALGVNASGAVLPDWLVIAMFLVLIPGWWFGYFTAMETLWRGRTLGKAALGLRVVTREGAPVRFRHAAIRTLLGLVDFGLGSGFFAVVFVLFSRDNQRLGDLVAGTLVLRERSAATQLAPVSFDPPPGLESYTATLDVTGMATEEYQAVRSFLLRARQLAPASRASLAVQLATPLAARLRPHPPDGLPPEGYLHAVAAAYQRRQRAAAGGQALPPQAPAAVWPRPVPATADGASPPPAAAPWGTPAPPPAAAPGSWSPPAGSWSPPPASPPGPGHGEDPAQPAGPAPAGDAGTDAPTEEPGRGGFAPPG